MSITLGFYDLFANMIPGLLCVYVINEALREFRFDYIDLNKLDNIAQIILVGIAAYILGHALNNASYLWYRIFFKKFDDQEALDRLRSQYKSLPLNFQSTDTKIILGVIQHHDFNLAQSLERHRATAIMDRGLSLGLFFYAILQIVFYFKYPLEYSHIIMALVGILVSILLFNRAIDSIRWFHRDIFLEALNYGSNLDEVILKSKEIMSKEPDHESCRKRNYPE